MSIRPSYRRGTWVGFHIEVNAEPVGRVYRAYKLAVLALRTFA